MIIKCQGNGYLKRVGKRAWLRKGKGSFWEFGSILFLALDHSYMDVHFKIC